jgi:RNAse (barnase) inhibitor barstar
MSSVIRLATGYYAENNTRYVFLDGKSCKKMEDCYDTLQQQLSLPGYFGKNLDALEEVLDDLEWIKEKNIKIIISGLASLLQNDLAKKQNFLDILHAAGNKKIEIIYLGKTTDK